MEEISGETVALFGALARAVRDARLPEDIKERAFEAVEALAAEVRGVGVGAR